jgi:four helix bundle protein
MSYKFENLEVWKLSMEYLDGIYTLADMLPKSEEFNLKSQIIRAGTSTCLNIAEGSQGQSDPEQARFLGMALRSLIETVACGHLIRRRKYLPDGKLIDELYEKSQVLAKKLQALRRFLTGSRSQIREDSLQYLSDSSMP